jgi:hypothetical protein
MGSFYLAIVTDREKRRILVLFVLVELETRPTVSQPKLTMRAEAHVRDCGDPGLG